MGAKKDWDEISDEAMDFEFPPPGKKAVASSSTSSGDYHATYYDRHKDSLSERASARWRHNEGGYRDRGLARAQQKRSQKRSVRADTKYETQRANFRSGWWCRSCHYHDGASGGKTNVCPACNAPTVQRAILVTVALCNKCERTLPWEGRVRACELELHAGFGVCPGKLEEAEKALITKPPRLTEVDGAEAWVYSSGTLAAMCGKSPSTIRTWLESRVVPGYSRRISGRYWFTQEFMEAVAEGYRKTLVIDGRAPHKKLRRWIKDELAESGVSYELFPPR